MKITHYIFVDGILLGFWLGSVDGINDDFNDGFEEGYPVGQWVKGGDVGEVDERVKSLGKLRGDGTTVGILLGE